MPSAKYTGGRTATGSATNRGSAKPVTGSPDDVARTSLGLLRTFAAIADESLFHVAPDTTLQQFRALTVLHERGSLKAAALAEALGIAPSTLTRLANRLVRDGLVERHADPDDRRAVVLAATARGNAACDEVKEWRLRKLATAYAGATRVERIELAKALSRAGELFTEGEE